MATFKTVGTVVKSWISNGGVLVFSIQAQDETQRVFNYAAIMGSPNPQVSRMGQAKLAELAKACGVMVMQDSDELNGCQIVFDHDGRDIQRVYPMKTTVVQYVDKPRGPSVWRRFLDRFKKPAEPSHGAFDDWDDWGEDR